MPTLMEVADTILPPRQLHAWYLKYIEELTVAEIAVELGIKPHSVSNLLVSANRLMDSFREANGMDDFRELIERIRVEIELHSGADVWVQADKTLSAALNRWQRRQIGKFKKKEAGGD